MAPIRPHEGLDECHDATEEDSTSSNTPYIVGIEDKLRRDRALRDLGPEHRQGRAE